MGFHVLLILPYYWLTVWMYNVQMLFVIQIKENYENRVKKNCSTVWNERMQMKMWIRDGLVRM